MLKDTRVALVATCKPDTDVNSTGEASAYPVQ